MAASFAAYASQYLSRQPHGATTLSSSQPMFFSFSTEDGSRAGHGVDSDLDDLHDPHLRQSGMSGGAHSTHDEDDDPYLRLDEDEQTSRMGFDSRHHQPQSLPFIASENGSDSQGSPKGWLAHLAASPARARSPSPSSSSSTDSDPPPEVFGHVASVVQPPPPPPPQRSRTPASLSLTQSLLPRDGRTRPLDVFTLPDPRHVPRGRRKYNDSRWTAAWCAALSISVFCSILLLFVARKPTNAPRGRLPYTTLLHTVPMLTILTFLSALAAYTHIFLLRIFVRPVMIATSVFIPATLFICAIWAFVGSFMWDGDQEPTWGETVGLRLFSLVPLALSLLTARRLLNLPRDIHTTSSTLTLTTHLLIANPFLLALSPAILLATLITSIPFLTLVFRLLLIGYPTTYKNSSTWEWHVYAWANWAIAAAVAIWLWTWGVARGVLRMTCASVIGAWYFADPDVLPPPPMSTHTIHAALVRSTGPSLGTIVISAMILMIIRMLTLFTLFLERIPLYIPVRALFIVSGIRLAIGYLDTITTSLSKYALVYAGLTGDPFLPSARRAKALTTSIEAKARNGRHKFNAEPPLTLLTVAPLTLTFPFALTTYLFVAHTLGAPDQALGAALLAGGVTALVGLFCVGLVKDTADTLYICYCIDKDVGERRREEVFIAFEYENRSRQQRRQRQPEDIIPLPPDSPPAINKHIPARPTPPQDLSNNNQRRVQQQRVPSYPEPRRPRQQLAPSASTSQQTQRPTPLPPPPPSMEDEDDPDPFKKSFAEEYDPAPLHLRRDGPFTPPPPTRMLTSAEMNMKSHIEMRPYSVSPSPERGRTGRSGVMSRLADESEDEEGSQLFPGSGIF